MTEEKDHEDTIHHEHKVHHSNEKKDEKYKFELSKVRIWQGVSLILLLAVVFLWFNPDFGVPEGAQVQVPPTQGAPPGQAPPQAIAKFDNIDEDDDPFLGDENAPVTIVSFEDYQCPFCKRAFDQTFPPLKKDYIDTGKVKYVYRDFPLSFHPQANAAAEASECANEQDKFWDYHDAIFNNQATLGRDLYIQLAGQLDLDVDQFTQCIDDGKYKQEVQADTSYGSQVGVSGTPTFFIISSMKDADTDILKQMDDGRSIFYGESTDGKDVIMKLVGALPYQAFDQIIEAQLG